MASWIFQANPQQFDVDGFLATGPSRMLWLAKQHANDMRVGDQVFLWRAIGGGDPKLSGIVAEARIVSLPTLQPDAAESLPYWIGNGTAPDVRVELELHTNLRGIDKDAWRNGDRYLSLVAQRLQPGGGK